MAREGRGHAGLNHVMLSLRTIRWGFMDIPVVLIILLRTKYSDEKCVFECHRSSLFCKDKSSGLHIL